MREKSGAAIDRRSGSARNAVIFFALAMVFRCLGLVNRFGTIDNYRMLTEILLPVAFCTLAIISIVFFGRRLLVLSMLPMVACLLFFIARSISADNILGKQPTQAESLIRIAVYIVLSALYSSTVQTEYRLKWLLIPAFLLGIAYHLVFEDYPVLFSTEPLTDFNGIMMELAVLFILFALVFMTFGFKAKEPPTGKKSEIPNNSENTENINGESIEDQENTELTDTDCTETSGETPEQETFRTRTESGLESGLESGPESGNEKAGETVLDESFFDRPYHATLTLEPRSEPENSGSSDGI